ncbi:unnamed protein product [Tilletia caries]|nr:unnamed protein product [Tilletia caries]
MSQKGVARKAGASGVAPTRIETSAPGAAGAPDAAGSCCLPTGRFYQRGLQSGRERQGGDCRKPNSTGRYCDDDALAPNSAGGAREHGGGPSEATCGGGGAEALRPRLLELEKKVESQDSGRFSDASSDASPRRRQPRASSARGRKRLRRDTRQAKTGPGRPDHKTQDALLELLRAGVGIDQDDDWADHPKVARDSSSWPRHPIPSSPAAAAARAPGSAGEELVGEPKDRLDWEGGRLDDQQFKLVLGKHGRTIKDQADYFGLPAEVDARTYEHIYAACHRTMDALKRACRVKRQLGADLLAGRKKAKEAVDRRHKRRKTRSDARQRVATAHPGKFGASVGDMIGIECVEGDESEQEDAANADDGDGSDDDSSAPRTKSIRVIVPGWWSKENQNLQQKLERHVSFQMAKFKTIEATQLTAYLESLSPAVPRIAVSSAFAQKYPHLVMDVKDKSPPFKPARGAVADDAQSWGAPITLHRASRSRGRRAQSHWW